MPEELTEIQKSILEYILDFKSGKGLPPTLAEIALKFGYRNRSTVQQHLGALEKKGFIKRNNRISRGIEVVSGEKNFFIRKVLGEVAAGSPLTIYPDTIDSVALPAAVSLPKGAFLLRVKGESMKDAYIFNGDLVIVNPSLLPPKDGQIVVAVWDNAAVVKRYYLKGSMVELHSENPEYQPIIVPADDRLRLIGVVVGMYRSMGEF